MGCQHFFTSKINKFNIKFEQAKHIGAVLGLYPCDCCYISVTLACLLLPYSKMVPHFIVISTDFYNFQTHSNVFLAGGGTSYILWFPGYPVSDESYVNMALEVPTNSEHPVQSNGMFNINPQHRAVPLCQFSL